VAVADARALVSGRLPDDRSDDNGLLLASPRFRPRQIVREDIIVLAMALARVIDARRHVG
jgi:hypothetical protein